MYNDKENWTYGYKELIIRHLDRLSNLSTRLVSDSDEFPSGSFEDLKINSMVWGLEFLQSIIPKDKYDKVKQIKIPGQLNDNKKISFKLRSIMNECDFIYEEDAKEIMTFGNENEQR